MRYGIAFKLALLLAIFGIVAMGMVGYYAYLGNRANLLAATKGNLLTATQVLGRSFQVSMNGVARDALMLARLPLSLDVLGQAAPDLGVDHDRLAQAFSAMMTAQPEYFQIRLIRADQHGLEQIRVDRDGDRPIRVTRDGLQEKAHFPYVFQTLAMSVGRVFMSDIILNHEQGAHAGLGQPTIRVATPVGVAGGPVLGLVVINLDLNSLFARLKFDLPLTYGVYLTNQKGDFLIHPNVADAFGFERGRRVLVQDQFAPVAALITGQSDSVIMQSQPPARLDDGAETGLVAAFLRLPFGEFERQRFVVLGLSRPLGDIMHETAQLGRNTLQIIAVLSALALVLAAWVSRVVTDPLKFMVRAMGQFTGEQVIRVLPAPRRDEMGVLAHSLNQMQTTIVDNMQELKDSRQALKHLAQHDILTGLPNRALFNDRLEQAVSQAKRDHGRMALLFVDLDGFKVVNDSHGHHAGDLLLVGAARRMLDCVRHADTVGRLGGDEFVLLLPSIDRAEHASRVAEKVREKLKQPFVLEGTTVHIACSVGVAVYPEDGGDGPMLCRFADAAMYRSKELGGNCVVTSGEGRTA